MLNGLFPDLEYYGIRPPLHVEQAVAEKSPLSHQLYYTLYSSGLATALNTTAPPPAELDWTWWECPGSFAGEFRPRWERVGKMADEGNRFFHRGLRPLVQAGQTPAVSSEPGAVTTSSIRHREFSGECY